jgi:hypothetical protein
MSRLRGSQYDPRTVQPREHPEELDGMSGAALRAIFAALLLAVCVSRAAEAPVTVAFNSGSKVLHGRLYKPAGARAIPSDPLQSWLGAGITETIKLSTSSAHSL